MESVLVRDRRTLTIGAVIIATMFALSRGVPRYRTWRAVALMNVEHETAALAHLEASAARVDRTAGALAKTQSGLTALDSLLLSGTSASSVATSLTAAISEAAEGAEVQLGSIQVHRDSAARTKLAHVTARATVSGDIGGLALFLESLEVGPPMLAVREWSISGGSETIATNQRAVLRLDVVVEGLGRLLADRGSR